MSSESYLKEISTLDEAAGFSTPMTQKIERKDLQLRPQCSVNETKVEDLVPIKLNWLAGFIDGEGSFQIVRSVKDNGIPYYYPRLRITNTNLYVLKCIQYQFEGSITTNGQPRPGSKIGWRWVLGGVPAGRLVNSLLNMLIVKREAAELFVRFCDYYRRPKKSILTMQEYKRKMNKVNRRGV